MDVNDDIKIFNILKKERENNRLSHAYLIEIDNNIDIDNFINYLVKVILCPENDYQEKCSKCKICNLIDNNNYPDLRIIDVDGNFIKKEQLLELKEKFSSNSIYGDKQIYIIKDATKLNSSSGNTILKFLEEPSSNTIAILLTPNRYSVLETLVSRCQILSLNINNNFNLDDDTILLIKTLFDKNKGFLSFNEIIDIIPNRSEAVVKFQAMINYLFGVLHGNFDLFEEINYLDRDKIIKLVIILEKYLSKFEYNLNYKLVLDSILIDVSEVLL